MAEIRVQSIALSATAPPAPNSPFKNVMGPGLYSDPSISTDPGTLGFHLIVATQNVPTINGDSIVMRIVDVGADKYGSTTLAAIGGVGTNEYDADVAGDGEDFLVVFTRQDVSGVGDRDVFARRVQLDQSGSTYVTVDPTDILIAKNSTVDAHLPGVALAGIEHLVAWASEAPTPFGLEVEILTTTVLKDSGEICESVQLAHTIAATEDSVEVASTHESGDLISREAVVAISDGDADMFARTWVESAATPPANIGGTCGSTSEFQLLGDLQIGSTDLVADLRVFDPNPTFAILNIAVGGAEFPCGPCIWAPFQSTVLVALEPSAGPSRTGSTPLAVPCLPGLEGAFVDLQFTILPTSSTGCSLFPELSISDRLRLTFSF